MKVLRQSDHEDLERQLIAARRERIELDAANEVTRLGRLEARIHDYPNAMRWDAEQNRLAVARALATNTRAMVQVGPGLDVASSLMLHSVPPEPAFEGATTAAVEGEPATGPAAEPPRPEAPAKAPTPPDRNASSRRRPAASGDS